MKLVTAGRHSKHQDLLPATAGQFSPRADVGGEKKKPAKKKAGLSGMNFEEYIDVIFRGAFPTQTKLTAFPG